MTNKDRQDMNAPEESSSEADSQDSKSGETVQEMSVENTVDSLKKRVAELEAELSEAKDKALRYLADAEGTRRRAQREREDTAKYAVGKFAKDLLAVADNLGRALAAIPPETREQQGVVATIIEGIEATERQLLSVFGQFGIKRFDPLDQPFDAHSHSAMAEVPGTGKPSGTVVAVMQCGYMIHDRLLREALVCVAQGDGRESSSSAPIIEAEPIPEQPSARESHNPRPPSGSPYGPGATEGDDHDSTGHGGARKIDIQT
ncbi:MAG: nucleotide exchange factor GrpE [Alphaproteobacteria bacterium]|nr:MAG: nucleotide exchange factor GrpE [Alphaproteobacteria bacterium]